MRLLISLALLAGLPASAAGPYFGTLPGDAGAWPSVLASVGFEQRPPEQAGIIVAPAGAAAPANMENRIENGAVLIVEGEGPLAEQYGFRNTGARVRTVSITDVHQRGLPIIWEKPLDLPVSELPPGAEVFARERWTGAPVTAGVRRGAGAILWVAASPGPRGYERFPYILNALCSLGATPPFRSSRLWAFFDSSYRLRVDPDYFAARWRQSGISALHIAAWHYYEPDPERDAYLRKLIEACHREAILVYAWLELPHVSEKFWADHPEWREQTALLQDAHLDWRKLMNLENRDCFRAVSSGVKQLLSRFDWDGVNLAELYFESLEGMDNPSRFTPMNADVRSGFRSRYGFDPIEIFGERKDEKSRRAFLQYRADLTRRMQEEWLDQMEEARRTKPYLDLTLTHVDDRFDTNMRDAIGADAARVLPLLDKHRFTFLIEDPATIWNLGPQRYATLASRYAELTRQRDRLAIDLNVVERYQDVYPTKQQTGAELFQLVHLASASFARLALYFESSLQPADLKLLSAAAANVSRIETEGSRITVDSETAVGVPWAGGAPLLDGKPWPLYDKGVAWLPPGTHTIQAGGEKNLPSIRYLNADLRSAHVIDSETVEISYQSSSRGLVILNGTPIQLKANGRPAPVSLAGPQTLFLPAGSNTVRISIR
jgi:hypothetical protein